MQLSSEQGTAGARASSAEQARREGAGATGEGRALRGERAMGERPGQIHGRALPRATTAHL